MNKPEIIEFEIPNFEKYHPIKGYKKTPWIRLDIDLWDDPTFSRLTTTQMLCFIHLITCCGRAMTGHAQCNVRNSASRLHVRPMLLRTAIKRLVELQLVKCSGETQKGAYERDEPNEHYETDGTNRKKPKGQQKLIATGVIDKIEKTHWLVDLWNNHCDKLPKARIPISPTRLKKIKVQTKIEPDKDIWHEVIIKMTKSKFCNGHGDTGWMADFDFLIKPESLAKILEGKYDNRAIIGKTKAQKVSDNNKLLWDKVERGEI